MSLVIAAIRTGHDPVGKLPAAAFHCQLDTQLTCPKCSATYNLIVDYDASVGRHFEEESRRPIMMLRKAIMLGHGNDHRIAHFETAGVVVTGFPDPKPASSPTQSATSDSPAARPPRSRVNRIL
jgi:hypothetical protein